MDGGSLSHDATTHRLGGTVNHMCGTFDGNGNRLSQTLNGTMTSYSYNAANQLTAAGATTL
jgi:hypothetical protein